MNETPLDKAMPQLQRQPIEPSGEPKAKVLVFVEGGIVTGYERDGDVEVAIFDRDDFDHGDEWDIPKGFETLVPDWLKSLLENRRHSN